MQPYIPQILPVEGLNFGSLIKLVGQANAELARYDGLLQGIPNPAVLLSPLTTQEAVLSSKIEGTQATLDEVLEYEAGQSFSPEKNLDIHEIVNYRNALKFATQELVHRQITLGLVREIHHILMESVRGANKEPGLFRNDQNWIGRAGCTMDEATFVPPNPLQLLDHLQAWERYLTMDDVDYLIQVAVVHAQFELLHPFKDGNGRIGRLLIPLFLYAKKVLSSPMFYLSGYLESNRDEYYERLKAISLEQDWNGWVAFFLRAIISQANDNAGKVKKILALYDSMKIRFREVTHSQFAIQSLDTIFSQPTFSSSFFVKASGIPTKQTAMLILRQLKEAGVLRVLQAGSGRRAERLAFPDLVNLAEGKTVDVMDMNNFCVK